MLCRNCGMAKRDHGITNQCPTQYQDESVNYWKPAGREHEVVEKLDWYNGQPEEATKKVNPKFHAALKRMAEVHNKKSSDYANDENRYQNFEDAAATAGVDVEEAFLVLIGVKLARLRELKKSGKPPSNESVQDTRLDLAVYSTLLLSYFEGV